MLRLLKSLSDMVVDLAKDPCAGSDFENDSVRSIDRVAVVWSAGIFRKIHYVGFVF